MMQWKRILAPLTLAVLTAGLLTACGQEPAPPEPTRTPAPTFTPTPAEAQQPVDPAAVATAQALAEIAAAEEQSAAGDTGQAADGESAPVEAAPTDTPIPEPTPTPIPVVAEVVINSNMNVRGGPGTNYGIVGGANQGERFVVTGKNADASWWQIDYNGQAGWVFAQLVTPSNTESVAVAQNIPAAPPPPPPTNTPVPAPAEPAPAPAEPAPAPQPADNFPYGLIEGVEKCAPNAGITYFKGFVRTRDNQPKNAVCVHIAYYEPRNTKCSGCDGVGDGNWAFSPFGANPAPRGTPIEIYVVQCPSGGMPMGGQTQGTGFGDLTPQSPKWTRVINDSEQCEGITFYQK